MHLWSHTIWLVFYVVVMFFPLNTVRLCLFHCERLMKLACILTHTYVGDTEKARALGADWAEQSAGASARWA